MLKTIFSFLFFLNVASAQTPIANSTGNGFGCIRKKLFEIKSQESCMEIYLEFNTDPHMEPGPFGLHWNFPLLSSSITPDDGDTFHWVSPDSLNYYFSSVGISINEDTKKEFKISIFTLGIPLDNIKLAEACYDEALFSYDCTFAKGKKLGKYSKIGEIVFALNLDNLKRGKNEGEIVLIFDYLNFKRTYVIPYTFINTLK